MTWHDLIFEDVTLDVSVKFRIGRKNILHDVVKLFFVVILKIVAKQCVQSCTMYQ
jgi:hypothetical protein